MIDFFPNLENKNEKIASKITFIDFAAESKMKLICLFFKFFIFYL